MTLCKISDQWHSFITFNGGDENCVHEYDADAIYDETDLTGKVDCIHCKCVISFNISNIDD